MISVECFPGDLWVSQRGGRNVVPSSLSKFVVPCEAELVLSQSDLRRSVSSSLVTETWEQLAYVIPQG